MKKIIVLGLIGLILVNALPSNYGGTTKSDYLLFIPDSVEEYHYDAPNGTYIKIMDAGMEYNLTFSKYSENISVVLYSPEYLEGIRNRSTYYEWRYLNGNFEDVEYGKYINRSACSVFINESGERIAFHIAIYSKADGARKDGHGAIWHLRIKSDGNTEIEDNIYVREAIAGMGASGNEFSFRVKPETNYQTYIEDTYHHESFRLWNAGNIPLDMTRKFEPYSPIINITNIDEIYLPKEGKRCNVTILPMYWTPQVIEIKERIIGKPLHVFSGEQITFNTSLSIPIHITIKISREGFDIIKAGNAYLQYEYHSEAINASFNQVLSFDLYLTGNGSAKVTVLPDKLMIIGIYHHGKWHNQSSTMSESVDFQLNGNEEFIRVAVKCYMENTMAKLKYGLTQENESEDSSYTYISVGKAPIPSENSRNSGINPVGLGIAVGFMVLMAVALGYHELKRRREKDKSKEEYPAAKGGKKRSRK